MSDLGNASLINHFLLQSVIWGIFYLGNSTRNALRNPSSAKEKVVVNPHSSALKELTA